VIQNAKDKSGDMDIFDEYNGVRKLLRKQIGVCTCNKGQLYRNV